MKNNLFRELTIIWISGVLCLFLLIPFLLQETYFNEIQVDLARQAMSHYKQDRQNQGAINQYQWGDQSFFMTSELYPGCGGEPLILYKDNLERECIFRGQANFFLSRPDFDLITLIQKELYERKKISSDKMWSLANTLNDINNKNRSTDGILWIHWTIYLCLVIVGYVIISIMLKKCIRFIDKRGTILRRIGLVLWYFGVYFGTMIVINYCYPYLIIFLGIMAMIYISLWRVFKKKQILYLRFAFILNLCLLMNIAVCVLFPVGGRLIFFQEKEPYSIHESVEKKAWYIPLKYKVNHLP